MEDAPAYTQENRFYTRDCDNVISEIHKEYPQEEVHNASIDLLIKDFISFLMVVGYNGGVIKAKFKDAAETIKE